MDLNITVGKDPISHGENQIVTVVVLNSSTGKELIRGFMGREIRDPIGVIVKKFTEMEGNLTRIFIIGENVTGTFVIQPRYRKQVMRVQHL